MAQWDRCVHDLRAPTHTNTRAQFTQGERQCWRRKPARARNTFIVSNVPACRQNENDQIFSPTDCKIECLLRRSQYYCGMSSKDTGTSKSLPAEGADWSRQPATAGDAGLQTLCEVMFCLPRACHVPV